ncbi:uncharacterized protein [Drosophila kikkawai]|uniref:DnaJ homolog subfamily B member 9 n=1 Tax=Drosophila kikkawai TaxID=30033 RepID=A0A6P4HVT8_DROKI|nr:chaperone protein DnaJ 2 [Drosophila kikkawai]
MLRTIKTGHLPSVRGLAGFGTRFNYQTLPKPLHRGENYYQVLNVPVCSSDQEIKSAFIELSKKYHPDANTQTRDSEVFIKICEAYQTLHRQNSRQLYDSLLRMQHITTTASQDTAFTGRQMSTRWSQYQSAMRSKQMSRSSQMFPKKTKSVIFKRRVTSQYLPMRMQPLELAVQWANKDGDKDEGESWKDFFPHGLIFYLFVGGLCGVGGLVFVDLVSGRHKKPMSEDDSESSSPE